MDRSTPPVLYSTSSISSLDETTISHPANEHESIKQNKIKGTKKNKSRNPSSSQQESNSSNEGNVTPTTIAAVSTTQSPRMKTTLVQTRRNVPPRKEMTHIKNNNNTNSKKSLLETSNMESHAPPLRPITDLVLGSTISGTIVGISSFGVFVKIPYDLKVNEKPGYALLHKSQIRNKETTDDDLSQMFRVGQVVSNLRVISVNYAKGEVGVSLRSSRSKRHPISDYQVGQSVRGKVASITEYGAFIDIGAKVNPLVHISRISQEKINNLRDVLNEGDTVSIRIIDIDEAKKSMSASMLSPEADEYLSWRSLRIRRTTNGKNVNAPASRTKDESPSKTELEFYENAIRDLEKALGV